MVKEYQKRKSVPRKNPRPKQTKKTGLNSIEKRQVKQLIRKRKEVYYIPAYQYCAGRAVSSGFKQGALTTVNCFGGSLLSCVGLTVGNTPGTISNAVNASSTKLYPTGGIKLSDGANVPYPSVPIKGDKALMKSMLCKIRISAAVITSVNADMATIKPLTFRCVVFKLKKGSRPAGLVPNLNTGATSAPSMFKNPNNEDVGLDDDQTPFEFDNLRMNTESLEVLRDFEFKLMNPVAASSTAPGADGYAIINNQNLLPTTKDLSFWLPVPKKPIQYNSDYNPDNWDYRTFCLVFAHRQGTTTTTSYYGSVGSWSMEASITSRIQEY